MERIRPSVYFADKFGHHFKPAEKIDSTKIEEARRTFLIQREIDRRTVGRFYAKVANLRPRGGLI